MNLIKGLIALSVLLFSFLSVAQEAVKPDSYISDELSIYMHAGSGTNYRILGKIIAGSEITATGQESNGYSQIIDSNGKKAWVESKYVSKNPSLRAVITELNSKLSSYAQKQLTNETALSDASSSIATLTGKNKELTSEVSSLTKELVIVKSKLKHQDQEILTQWFFNGALVLGIGLLLGIILPRFFGKKRKTSSWG